MINVGILDGDLITVRRQATANNGEIVVAMTDLNEATCKTYFKRANHFVLRPENDQMGRYPSVTHHLRQGGQSLP